MTASQKKAVSIHRRRLKRRGFMRLEVRVRKDDVPLIRGAAQALSDPSRETDARALLRKEFGAAQTQGLKALLAAAPLDGIELTRDGDGERDIAL